VHLTPVIRVTNSRDCSPETFESDTQSMATSTATETVVSAAEVPSSYGCVHIEHILKKYGERIRREYDSAMSVVIQPASSKAAKVKVRTSMDMPVMVDVPGLS
jgi:hypothetical protein